MVRRAGLSPEQVAEIRAKDRAAKAALPIEQKRAYNASWRETVTDEWREQKRAYNRERYARQREAFAHRRKARYAAHLDEERARGRERYLATREAFIRKQMVHTERRRVRLLGGQTFRVSKRDWDRLVARYGGCCAYCGMQPSKLHREHVVPVSRGGAHSIGNLLPTCERCNKSKGAKTLMEWRLHRMRYPEPERGVVTSQYKVRLGG